MIVTVIIVIVIFIIIIVIFMMCRFYKCAGFTWSNCVVRLLLETCAQIPTILPTSAKYVSVGMTSGARYRGYVSPKLHVATYRNQQHCWWFHYGITNHCLPQLKIVVASFHTVYNPSGLCFIQYCQVALADASDKMENVPCMSTVLTTVILIHNAGIIISHPLFYV